MDIMDIYVGRGGNQLQPLTEKGIPPLQCLIERDEDNDYMVSPTSVMPTLVNGERIFDKFFADSDAVITLGNGTEYPISQLAKPLDAARFTDWGVVSRHIPDAISAKAFNKVSLLEYPVNEDGDRDMFLWDNVAACEANYLIDENKLRQAQELLYEAGDSLYAMQDGSTERKGAYASLLVVLGKLYKAAGRDDVAAKALDGARRVFATGVECSEEVKTLLNSLS